ncbi:hypothetical protein NWP96_01465 [Mycoplasmopsis cynos]|nr:hypothetical protein [Mycoplasmopsis cynos]
MYFLKELQSYQFEKYLDENKLDKKLYKFNDFKLATVSNVIVNEEKNSINVEFKFKDNSIHSYEMLQGEVTHYDILHIMHINQF